MACVRRWRCVQSARTRTPRHTRPPRQSNAAIVTTVKHFAPLCVSWCAYHLSIGFRHLFVYFDDPAELDGVRALLLQHFAAESLTLVAHDAALRLAWSRLELAAHLLPHAGAEVQTRQQLNCRHAMALAVRQGLRWLVHLDADELFFPNREGDAAAHFAQLDADGVETFVYMNFEAVPERVGVVDPFAEVTLFKRSLDLVEPTARARRAVALWQARHEGSFFYYYDNGKAAVRVHPKAKPLSVHEWLPGSPEGMQRWYSNLTTPWRGRGNLEQVVKYRASEARILHYPVYSIEALWHRYVGGMDRYTLKGRVEPPPFHDQASHDARVAAERGGEDAARATLSRIFREKVMLGDPAEVEAQLAAGVCERITEALQRIKAWRSRS
ncbi:hypothetical protein AB1Y20_011283 [Prymnesium parvum]|uniref:Glycosyltransferase family 92 protein n=1 Tax=Prymnesium parvum TaxID=97485 RepID=A0AB34IMG1_PRYPA